MAMYPAPPDLKHDLDDDSEQDAPEFAPGRLGWHASALCAQVDPELFFPERGASAAPAKRICAACPVRAECLEDALARRISFGIWGGLSERERRRLTQTAPASGAEMGAAA